MGLQRYLERDVVIVPGTEDRDPGEPHRVVQLDGAGHDAGQVLAAPETRAIQFG